MKGKFWKKALAASLALLIVSGSTPIKPLSQVFDRTVIKASAATAGFEQIKSPITYIGENGEEVTVTDYTVLTGEETVNQSGQIILAGGTYVVTGELNYCNMLFFQGDTTLILKDNANLTINMTNEYLNGITCFDGNDYCSLSVYGQSNGTGELDVSAIGGSGIGCANYKQYGGKVTATAVNNTGVNAYYDFMIYGGELTANSAENAAINSFTGCIYFNGGTVSATTASGQQSAIKLNSRSGSVYFNGGTVEATTTSTDEYADAIYSSNDMHFDSGTVIANGRLYLLGTCYLNGGIVKANSYNVSSYSITGTYSNGTNLYTGEYNAQNHSNADWWTAFNAELDGKTLAPAYVVNLPESTTGGSISADKSFVTANAADKTVTLTVTPDEGYAVKSVKYNDTEITPVNGVYSFTMPAENVTVSAEYESEVPQGNVITLNENGKFETDVHIDSGTIDYTFTPAENGVYRFYSASKGDTYAYLLNADESQITYNDDDGEGSNFKIESELTAGQTYILRMKQYSGNEIDFKLTAEKVVSYRVSVSDNITHGTITADKNVSAQNGHIFLTLNPETGYKIANITVMQGDTPINVGLNDSNISAENPFAQEWHFVMPAGDVSVSAEFTPITAIPADGVISSNGVYSFIPDETGIYKFEFDSHIDNLKLLTGTDVFYEGQGSQLTAHLTAGETYYLLTSEMGVNISNTVNVTYSKLSAYTITSSAVENGSVSFLSSSQEITEASEGETVIISPAPDYGCKLKNVTVNKASGDAVTVNTNTSYNLGIDEYQTTYSFTMPAENVTVSAEFEVDPTILRIGDNTIADTQGQYVNHFFTPTESGKYYFAASGENPNVSFTLFTGNYSYINDGTNAVLGNLEAGTKYRLQINTNSSDNITVKVKKAETHSVTLDNTAEHGTFSAVNSNKEPISGAYEGERVYVKAEPEEGYSLKRLVVTDAQGNPVKVETDSFIMPTSDVTVSAVFGEFSAKLDEEGTLHLSGDVTVSDVQSFSKNPAVKKIVADEGTVLPENCRALFYQFGSVTEIDLSSADASNVTNMLDMFSNCSALKKITFGDHFNTANVEVMAFMFFNCSSLTELDLSRFDTSNVRSLYCTFRYCSDLETLDLSSFNTAKLTNLDHTFADCTNLKTVYVSDNWNTDSVTTSNNMFLNCTSLVGGAETAYDSGHVTKDYARIDGGTDAPGYLTYKAAVLPTVQVSYVTANGQASEEVTAIVLDENTVIDENFCLYPFYYITGDVDLELMLLKNPNGVTLILADDASINSALVTYRKEIVNGEKQEEMGAYDLTVSKPVDAEGTGKISGQIMCRNYTQYAGQVTGMVGAFGDAKEESDAIDGTITLDFTDENALANLTTYDEENGMYLCGSVVIPDGKALTDGTDIYSGTLTGDAVKNISGKTLVPYAAEESPLTAYMNLTIIDGTAIGINFFFEVNEGELSDYTVNYGGKSTLISDLPTKTVSGKTLPCLSMTSPAKRMTDKMTVTVMKGETEIKKIEKSIVDYSDILLSDANASDYYDLIKAMLNYGAAAQTYFGYDTEHLANQNCPLDYTDVTIPAKTFEDKQTMLDILAAENSPVSYYAMNLTLESETELSIHFNIKDSFTMEQAKAYLATFTVDGSPAVVGEKNGRPVITIKNIPAKTLFKTYSISNGEQNFGVSVDMYMTAVMNGSDENLKALCKALYQFFLAKS